MLTQNKYDLILIGNIIIDEVYCIQNWIEGTSNNLISHRTSVGGIGNIVENIPVNLNILINGVIGNDSAGKIINDYFLDKHIETNLATSYKPTSKALILSNLDSKERTSFVNWGCAVHPILLSNKETRWSHISYLDMCLNLDVEYIRKQSEIVSADLCLSNPPQETIDFVLKQLKWLDYLFISESEFVSIFNCSITESISIIKKYELKCLILHTKIKTYIIEDTITEINNKNVLLDNVDVVGAGDNYCAGFILYQLKNKRDNNNAVTAGHALATKLIQSRSNN